MYFKIIILCLSVYEGFYIPSMDTSIDFREHGIRLRCFFKLWQISQKYMNSIVIDLLHNIMISS